eukprot:GHVL01002235.1.p1 GENE.GHVL01002235.1~~GHVL01002235.1.p1  ORF type:complete len:256 (-),score=49.02 GHVL01002235.1:1351-2118(-)
MALFKEMLNRWLSATILDYDIWQVIFDVKEDGCFKKIKEKEKMVVLKEEETAHTLKFIMINYFSFGVESRIGLGFDRHRRNSAAANKLVYANEGFKKMFKKTANIPSLISQVYRDVDEKEEIIDTEKGPTFKGSPASLVAINTCSFAGGCSIWQNCVGKVGINIEKDPAFKDSKQDMGDGKLEWLTFNSSMGLGMEQVFKGQARRLHQGEGPFKIIFKSSDLITYMQVDGEFYQVIKPATVTIQLYNHIKVLKSF